MTSRAKAAVQPTAIPAIELVDSEGGVETGAGIADAGEVALAVFIVELDVELPVSVAEVDEGLLSLEFEDGTGATNTEGSGDAEEDADKVVFELDELFVLLELLVLL